MASKIAIWCWLLAVNSSRNIIWSLSSSPHLSMSLSNERMLGFPHIWVPKVTVLGDGNFPSQWPKSGNRHVTQQFFTGQCSHRACSDSKKRNTDSSTSTVSQWEKNQRIMTIFNHLCIDILNFSEIEGGFHYLHYYLLFRKLSFRVIGLVKYINLFKTIIYLPFKWVSGGRRGGETILNQIYQRII